MFDFSRNFIIIYLHESQSFREIKCIFFLKVNAVNWGFLKKKIYVEFQQWVSEAQNKHIDRKFCNCRALKVLLAKKK